MRTAASKRNTDSVTGGVAEYANAYQHDGAGRLTQVTQAAQAVAGAHAVSEKRVDFAYNRLGQFDTVRRYSDAAGASAVAATTYSYDSSNRLDVLRHTQGTAAGALLAGYDYAYDEGDRITAIDFLPDGVNSAFDYSAEDVVYTYDARGQIDTANYGGDADVEEDYNFDKNGNRVGQQEIDDAFAQYESTAGVNNRLLDDGTYRYAYDGEGNRTARWVDTVSDGVLGAGDTDIAEYEWDHRNRLTRVTLKPTYASAGETVAYGYDHANRLVSRVHDTTPGVAGGESRTVYVFSGGQVVLQFEGPGSTLAASNLAHRYLWGPAVDQLLADEQVDWTNSQADGDTLWALTDHLGTVRDLVDDTGALVNHLAYDTFGNVLSATSTVDTTDFGYTGKLFDATVGLQNNWNRWYDAKVGKWVSEDPIGFEAGDANLGRYVWGTPTTLVDPTGEAAVTAVIIVAAFVGGVLMSPNVANAPGPNDATYPAQTLPGGAVQVVLAGGVIRYCWNSIVGAATEHAGGGRITPGGRGPIGAPASVKPGQNPSNGTLAGKGPVRGNSSSGFVPSAKAPKSSQVATGAKQFQKKFKHAKDFGVTGNKNPGNIQKFNDAVQKHLNGPNTKHINGTYHKQPATISVDPNTGLAVIRNPNGAFVSGWKLSPDQLRIVLTDGTL